MTINDCLVPSKVVRPLCETKDYAVSLVGSISLSILTSNKNDRCHWSSKVNSGKLVLSLLLLLRHKNTYGAKMSSSSNFIDLSDDGEPPFKRMRVAEDRFTISFTYSLIELVPQTSTMILK